MDWNGVLYHHKITYSKKKQSRSTTAPYWQTPTTNNKAELWL
jgi:hypothetical protein